MCTQKPPNDYSDNLYTRYKIVFEDYIKEVVCGLGTWLSQPPDVFAGAGAIDIWPLSVSFP